MGTTRSENPDQHLESGEHLAPSLRPHPQHGRHPQRALLCPALLAARCSLLCLCLCFSPGVSRAPCPASLSSLSHCAPCSRSSRRRCCTVHLRPRQPLCSPVQPCARHHRAFFEHAAAVHCICVRSGTSRSRHARGPCCPSPTGLHRRPPPLSAASAPSRDELCDDVAESPITPPSRILH